MFSNSANANAQGYGGTTMIDRATNDRSAVMSYIDRIDNFNIRLSDCLSRTVSFHDRFSGSPPKAEGVLGTIGSPTNAAPLAMSMNEKLERMAWLVDSLENQIQRLSEVA